MSGKSTLCKKIVQNKDRLFTKPPSLIIWVYNEENSVDEELRERSDIIFTKELSDIYTYLDGETTILVILDDRTTNLLQNNKEVIKLFVQTVHHFKLIFVLVIHAIFIKDLRLANLQTNYLLITKNIRDKSSILALSYQISPLAPKLIYSAYEYTIRDKKFADFCICLHPNDHEKTRFRSSVFFWENITIFLPTSSI